MKKWDIIIIGSGMGGLVCGNVLALEGYKVCILEKNKQIGGSLQIYVRDRVIFDSGVHYIGGLEKGQNMYQIFKYLGLMDKLHIQQQDPGAFDKVLIEGDPNEYVFAQGYENFIKKLLIHFPEEEKGLREYCEKIRHVCSRFPLYNLRSGGQLSEKASVLEMDTKGVIESVTSNPKLQQVLAGNNALYAGQPDKTPFYVHALILNSYIESSWKCVDGGSQIAKYLAMNIRSLGGEVLQRKEVSRIVEEGGRVTHVELKDGSKMFADYFISNMHPVRTLELTDSLMIRSAYRTRLKNLENSISSFTLNLVFKKNCFPYISHNYYVFNEGRAWSVADYTEENWPLGYAVFVAASSKSAEFADGMTILTYMRYDDVKKWEKSFNTVVDENNRGEDYDQFKVQKAETLLNAVERKFPNLRACVDKYYTATPLSYRDYIGNDDGSLYGIVKDYREPLKTFISPRTKIPNFYLTGQNLNLHGILGAAMNALVTSCAFLDSDKIIDKIRNA